MSFHPGSEEDGSARSSWSGNEATDTASLVTQGLAAVADTYGHVITTPAAAGSSAVCPTPWTLVLYSDSTPDKNQCSEDLQHHSPTINV